MYMSASVQTCLKSRQGGSGSACVLLAPSAPTLTLRQCPPFSMHSSEFIPKQLSQTPAGNMPCAQVVSHSQFSWTQYLSGILGDGGFSSSDSEVDSAPISELRLYRLPLRNRSSCSWPRKASLLTKRTESLTKSRSRSPRSRFCFALAAPARQPKQINAR